MNMINNYKYLTNMNHQNTSSKQNGQPSVQKILVNLLKQQNSFGYKLVQKKQLRIIQNWLESSTKISLNISIDQVQFFCNIKKTIACLIAGLTEPGDYVTVIGPVQQEVVHSICGLGRKIMPIDYHNQGILAQQLYSKTVQSKLNSSRLLLLNNTGFIDQKNQEQSDKLLKILKIAKDKNIYIISNESMDEFGVNQPNWSLLSQNYQNKIVIKQLGGILRPKNISKHIVFYGSQQIKNKVVANCSKILKILPGDLTLGLIKIKSHPQYKRLQKQRQKQIIFNFNKFKQLLISLRYKNKVPEICKTKYFIIWSQKVDQNALKNILNNFDTQMLLAQNYKQYIKVNLNISSKQFMASIERTKASIINPRL